MATKKQARSTKGKKAGKPAPRSKAGAKKARPVKTAKKTGKPAAKKAAHKKQVLKKNSSKKTPKIVAKKPVQKSSKPAAKPVKPAPKVAAKPEPPVQTPLKKSGSVDPKSLVSIKPKVKPITKKEPPKPLKVVIPKTTTKSSVKYEPEFTKSVLDTGGTFQHSGPTMRYSDADLAEFREIIQKKLDAAKKELSYLQGLITRKDEGGDMDEARYMTMEDGSVSMEREQLSQMASRQITFIDHLEKAMMRIENKTYGICRVTGKLIDKARLRAVPHATLSIEAKQMMSK